MKVKKAFTLVELLVVIAIIAVLMSVLMPALQKARLQATCAVCVSNQHGLSVAYAIYADDNQGRLVMATVTRPGQAAPYESPWVCSPMTEDGTILDRGSPTGEGGDPATLEDRLRGIRAGKLYEYTETTDIYHCPGDRRITEGTYFGSSPVYRMYRTYSIQLPLGWRDAITRMSQIKNPGATYGFVEEYYDGWVTNYNGGFILNPNDPDSWWSVIAIWHGDIGTLGFVDGHAEKKKWVDERTVDLELSRTYPNQPDNPDLQYMMRGYAIKAD